MTYNINEKLSDNHYNCPVVAYYSELLSGNVERLKETEFLFPYLNVNSVTELSKELYSVLNGRIGEYRKKDIKNAVKKGFAALKS